MSVVVTVAKDGAYQFDLVGEPKVSAGSMAFSGVESAKCANAGGLVGSGVREDDLVSSAPPPQGFARYSELLAWPNNPRRNEKASLKVADSLRRFGFVAPVVVWTSRNRIVAGHTRIKALAAILANEPGFTPRHTPAPGLVPVRFVEFASEQEAELYGVADNRLGELAEWENEALAGILAKATSVDAGVAGYEGSRLAAILAELTPKPMELAPITGKPSQDTRPPIPYAVDLPPRVHKKLLKALAKMPGITEAARIEALCMLALKP